MKHQYTTVKRIKNIGLLGLILLCFFSSPVLADLFKKVDASGHVYFTDTPKGSGYQLFMRTPKKGTVAYQDFEKNRRRHSSAIQKQARHLHLDPALVMAVIHTESAYDENAVSKAGAVGLMQLMPQTAKSYGVKDRRNPTQNIKGGTRYLRDLLERYDFNIKLALAAYNAGESAVAKYGNNVPPYPETQTYIKRVVSRYQQYMSMQKNL